MLTQSHAEGDHPMSSTDLFGPRQLTILSISSIKGGDVLLCCGDSTRDLATANIAKVTGSAYTHAALCLDSNTAVEATTHGVVISSVADLLACFDHIAVFRRPEPEYWNAPRLRALEHFARLLVAKGAAFNLRGLRSFERRRENHQRSMHDNLTNYFEGTFEPESLENKTRYFCSELVADCFRYAGLYTTAAAIIYQSNVIAPVTLGRDVTFGYLFGFLCEDAAQEIPESDDFYRESTLSEIFCGDDP